MTVLFVSHTGRWGGGAEVVLGQMIEALSDTGCRIELACPAGDLERHVNMDEESIHRLPYVSIRRTSNPGQVLHALAGWLLSSIRVGIAIRRSDATIVHANSGVAAILSCLPSVLLRKNLVWHQHDIVPRRRVNALVLKPVGYAASLVVACSKAVEASLCGIGIPAQRVVVLYNRVRSEFFEPVQVPSEVRQKLGLPNEEPVVALIGRLVPYKGHQDFLTALAILRRSGLPVHGVIAGDKPPLEPADIDAFPTYLDGIRDRISELELDDAVIFFAHQRDIRPLLAASDAVAVPSLDEPFPLVVLEAMAAGVPVVASDSGGHPEAICSGESGLLFRSSDPEELARSLHMVLTDPGLAARLAQSGRYRARSSFSESTLPSELTALYHSTVSR